MFCPFWCYVPKDVLSLGCFFPLDVLYQGCFVPGHLVSGRYVPGRYVSGRFVYIPPNPHLHSYCYAGIWLAGCWPWNKEILPLANILDRIKQEIRGLCSTYICRKYARLKFCTPDVIRIILNLPNAVLLREGGLIYSTAVGWTTSNVHWVRGLTYLIYIYIAYRVAPISVYKWLLVRQNFLAQCLMSDFADIIFNF